MKKIIWIFFICFITSITKGQLIYDFKVKSENNTKDRTMMLDILRAKLYESYHQEFVFVVNHFKVGNNYAWLMADIQRKDGKRVQIPEDGGLDCCHIEALLKKNSNKWYIVESVEFSTDVWWQRIYKRYPKAPKAIFDELGSDQY